MPKSIKAIPISDDSESKEEQEQELKQQPKHAQLVLATSPGNPPAVRVFPGGSVQFGSLPAQEPEPLCLGGFVARTGPKPWVF